MDIAANLASIRSRIEAACLRASRDPSEVSLLAVSKGQPAEAVADAAASGQIWFGESKVQEARAKIPQCPASARWHMIGHLQTNKARDAVHLFEMIESVDSLRLAEDLQKAADKAAKTVRILLEVNAAGESTKFGYSPALLLEEFMRINAFPRLEIHGLMTIAPWSPSPERARPVFRRLRELRSQCEDLLGAPLPTLSMGMSGDFETAIEEGSTLVRVGTSLFGSRSPLRRDPAAEPG
ncbi:MAG TPA: YggS family pyridoxal phosphate-dependent enzyme [Verrucomicrobiales bacterium]|nr:YggS family pyridoxal phosphate-dependent enzyme [Verrucomicrobiales bacterium]